MTDFSNRINILVDFWTGYKQDPEFSDFIEITDIAFSLAFLIKHGHVLLTEKGEGMLNNLWIDFLEYLDVEDTGFEELGEIYFVS